MNSRLQPTRTWLLSFLLFALAWMIFVVSVRGAVQHKGAHREPVKVRDASGRVRIIYSKKLPPLPFKAEPVSKAEASKRAKALAEPMTPVPLWLVWWIAPDGGLQWDANPAEEEVTSYRVFRGTKRKEDSTNASGAVTYARYYEYTNDVGNVTYVRIPVVLGTNYMSVTATNAWGENNWSEEVWDTPIRCRISRTAPLPSTPNPVGVFVVQSRAVASDPWVTLTVATNQGSLALSTTNGPRFFRVGVLP